MRKLLALIILIIAAPVFAGEIFQKIDDDKVNVTTTTQISVNELLRQRVSISSRINEIDRQYQSERSELQSQINIIDKQLKGSISAGAKINIDPIELDNQTVFSAAGSLTGESDIP